jgi:hypothetical protein
LAPFILDQTQIKNPKHSEFELPEKFHGNNKIEKEGHKRGAFQKSQQFFSFLEKCEQILR